MKPFILLIIICSCSAGTQIQLPTAPTPSGVSKAYVDSAISDLKLQLSQYKYTIDSLKNTITANTIRVDTTSGSDFNLKNGVMTFNRPNVLRMINVEILRHVPATKTIAKKRGN